MRPQVLFPLFAAITSLPGIGPKLAKLVDGTTLEGDMRSAFYMAYREEWCEHLALDSPEVDRRVSEGPPLVSAYFVIPYPPGFPIMVPGQVIEADTIEFMRKLDVKEIHGYDGALGLKLIRAEALAARPSLTPAPTGV